MSDEEKAVLDGMDDIELITRYLNGQLAPEQAAEVRKRLEEDQEFRDLAAPLFLAWSIPPRIERKPRPEGELERAWEEFVRRTGFGQAGGAHDGSREANGASGSEGGDAARRPRRRRWGPVLLLVVALAVAAGAIGKSLYEVADSWKTTREDFHEFDAVPHDTGWVRLADSIFARLEPDARLERSPRVEDHALVLRLAGTARFRVAAVPDPPPPRREPPPSEGVTYTFGERVEPPQRATRVIVITRAGEVTGERSEFTITARADTTWVRTHFTEPYVVSAYRQTRVTAVVTFDTTGLPLGERSTRSYSVPVHEGEVDWIVKGVVPPIYVRKP